MSWQLEASLWSTAFLFFCLLHYFIHFQPVLLAFLFGPSICRGGPLFSIVIWVFFYPWVPPTFIQIIMALTLRLDLWQTSVSLLPSLGCCCGLVFWFSQWTSPWYEAMVRFLEDGRLRIGWTCNFNRTWRCDSGKMDQQLGLIYKRADLNPKKQTWERVFSNLRAERKSPKLLG